MGIFFAALLVALCVRLDADGFLNYDNVDMDLTGGKDYISSQEAARSRRHWRAHARYTHNLVKQSVRNAKARNALCLGEYTQVFIFPPGGPLDTSSRIACVKGLLLTRISAPQIHLASTAAIHPRA